MHCVSFLNSLRDKLKLLLRVPSPADRAGSDDPRALLGGRGERVAARFLRKNGYKILYRNFRAPKGGEVDLVCRDKRENVLAFVEVKTREGEDPVIRPSDAVTPAKQQLVARGALEWLRMLGNPEIAARFDVVEVIFRGEHASVEILKNAFELPAPYIY